MDSEQFEESKSFNLVEVLEYQSNSIVVKNIKIENNCQLQAFVFDFGKVQSYDKSPDLRFLHILEGKAEIVINNNSNFMRKGDSIIIPRHTSCSIEANHKFKMISITLK